MASTTILLVNGLPANMASFYLDGVYNNACKNGAGGNAVPNPDALEEFHLITINFDAEFGRTPAAVVNVITRSGTQNFHGEIPSVRRRIAGSADSIRWDSLYSPYLLAKEPRQKPPMDEIGKKVQGVTEASDCCGY